MKTKNYLISAFLILGACIIFTSSCKKDDPVETETGTVTDADGNVYKTVKIGTQTWMAENLKTTKYRNGDAIPEVTGITEWGDLTTGAYCNYDNNAANAATYGRLYNWYAVNESRNLAPTGWHVATYEDWETLTNYLGGFDVAGGKLKETGTAHWESPNEGATDEVGFKALPGGGRFFPASHNFNAIGLGSEWWSINNTGAIKDWAWDIMSSGASIRADYFATADTDGLSVRCVKD
ncbi:MAG: fibrobacter succinogenes major paralogous domain-containing protein [Bacteroidales bacterium]|nr:fibrobacter succinogenes major paralogous domain-containing protein [Bacteroidales bacterium]